MNLIFYEKQGCVTNGKQKKLLKRLGIDVSVVNIVEHCWAPSELELFFVDKPIGDCVNPSAPAIKDGKLKVSSISREELYAAMIDSPILIKRPLMRIDQNGEALHLVGFDLKRLETIFPTLNWPKDLSQGEIEQCSQPS